MKPLSEQRDREVARTSGRKMASPFTVKVVGVSFVDGYPENLYELAKIAPDGMARMERPTVVLVRNPDNKFDANAIEVHVPAIGEKGMIGHLTRPIAARLAPELDAGEPWLAEIESVLIDPDHMDRPGISVHCQRGEQDG